MRSQTRNHQDTPKTPDSSRLPQSDAPVDGDAQLLLKPLAKPLPNNLVALNRVYDALDRFVSEYQPIDDSLASLQTNARARRITDLCTAEKDQRKACYSRIRDLLFNLRAPRYLFTEHLDYDKEELHHVLSELIDVKNMEAEKVIQYFDSIDGQRTITFIRGLFAAATELLKQIDKKRDQGSVQVRPKNEDRIEQRNKWIYEQLCAKVPHKRIIAILKDKKRWFGRNNKPIKTYQGLKKAARAYRKNHPDLPDIPNLKQRRSRP